MLYKFFKILRLNDLIYRLISFFQSQKTFVCNYSSLQEAYSLLQVLHPDPKRSCIVSRELPVSSFDLEIVVPCYNSEKYIKECIDSVLSQITSFKFCLTIVNDGSTDKSSEVINKYSDVSNIRIIEQNNKGLSGARNTAISQCRGKYLMFVDSDDVLCPGAIDTLLKLAFSYDADVVDSGHIRFADRLGGGKKYILKAGLYDFLQKPQILSFNTNATSMTGFPCGKLFKSTLFSGLQFPEGYWYEDTMVSMILAPLCSKIVHSDIVSFRYRMNPTSISHQHKSNPKALDTLYVVMQLLRDREKLELNKDQKFYNFILRQFQHNFNRVLHMPKDVLKAVFFIQTEILNQLFPKSNTDDIRLMAIEDFHRNKDFSGFLLWVKWH